MADGVVATTPSPCAGLSGPIVKGSLLGNSYSLFLCGVFGVKGN